MHRKPHSVVREEPDHHERRDGEQPPGYANTKPAVQRVGEQISSETARGGWTEDVVDEITPRRNESHAASEAAGRERVISTARRHVARELRNRVSDKQAHDGRQEERDGHRRASLHRDDGEREYDICGWCDVSYPMENKFGETERVAAELRIARRVLDLRARQ